MGFIVARRPKKQTKKPPAKPSILKKGNYLCNLNFDLDA